MCMCTHLGIYVCAGLISIVVIKHLDREQPKEKGFMLAYNPSPQSSCQRRHSSRTSRQLSHCTLRSRKKCMHTYPVISLRRPPT